MRLPRHRSPLPTWGLQTFDAMSENRMHHLKHQCSALSSCFRVFTYTVGFKVVIEWLHGRTHHLHNPVSYKLQSHATHLLISFSKHNTFKFMSIALQQENIWLLLISQQKSVKSQVLNLSASSQLLFFFFFFFNISSKSHHLFHILKQVLIV